MSFTDSVSFFCRNIRLRRNCWQDKIVLVLSPEDFNSNSQGDWDSSVGISKVANIDTSKLLFLCVCFHLVFIVPHIVLWSITRQSFYLYIFSLLLCVMTSFFPCSLIRGLIIKIFLLLLATRSEATDLIICMYQHVVLSGVLVVLL